MEEEFYSVVPNETKLRQYLRQPRIRSIRFDPARKSYVCTEGARGGLHSALKKRFYPVYQRKRRSVRATKRHRHASSLTKGKEIDYQLQEYVKSGRKPTDTWALCVVQYLEQKMEHEVVATQIPTFVCVSNQERITQADVITKDCKNRLWMWEIKSGWNQANAQGTLKRPLTQVPNKDHNHWELQRHYTHAGLVASGLPIYRSHVLNVFQEDNTIVVDRRSVPKWCNLL